MGGRKKPQSLRISDVHAGGNWRDKGGLMFLGKVSEGPATTVGRLASFDLTEDEVDETLAFLASREGAEDKLKFILATCEELRAEGVPSVPNPQVGGGSGDRLLKALRARRKRCQSNES